MDNPVRAAKSDEEAFITRTLQKLAALEKTLADDFVTPEASKPRKPQLVQVPITPLPEAIGAAPPTASSSNILSITVKSIKPPLSFPISNLSPTETVAALKALVAASDPSAPPPDFQRLLLKGKALNDAKLLKDYALEDGSVVTLSIKPGWVPGPAAISSSTSPPSASSGATVPGIAIDPAPTNPTAPSAVPTLTISIPNASSSCPVGISELASGEKPVAPSALHSRLADPEFWLKLHDFYRSQFDTDEDADFAWDQTMMAMQSRMSPSEIARARDTVGVSGLGGGL